MELKEAREMAVDLITVKDTPVYIRPMCEAFMLLDDRVTELEIEIKGLARRLMQRIDENSSLLCEIQDLKRKLQPVVDG